LEFFQINTLHHKTLHGNLHSTLPIVSSQKPTIALSYTIQPIAFSAKGPVMNKTLASSTAAKQLAAGALALTACLPTAFAQDMGRVLSSTAIITQTQVPRQTCTTETVVQTGTTVSKSGAGAVMGGVTGAVLGNAVGQGQGRAAATMLGILGGAILGDKVEGGNVQAANATQNVQRCTTQTFLENRTTGYNVVYEYAGKQYSVVMPNDPGPTIQLQIAPLGTLQPAAAAPAPVAAPVAAPVLVTPATTSQVYVVPQQVVVASPAVVVAAPVVTYAYPAVVGSSVVIGSSYYGHSHRGFGPNVYWGAHGRPHYWR
jgi:uncharacterized protein YcfJ